MDQVLSQVSTAITSGDASRLTTAWARSNAIHSAIAQLPIITTPDGVGGLTQSVATFHQQIGEQLEDVRHRADEMRAALDTMHEFRNQLQNDIEDQKGRLDGAITAFNEQAADDRRTRADEYTAGLNDLREAKATFERESSAQMKSAQEAYDETLDAFEKKFDKHLDAWGERADEEATSRTEQAEQLIQDLETQLAKAENIVEIIGEVGQRGFYGKSADRQKEAADKWRLAAVVVGVLAIVSAIAVAVVEVVWIQDPSWTDILRRATITIALIALATFLGNQSLSHRRREEEYRTLELELATLDTFLNSLDDSERQRIKAELAMRYFKGVDRNGISLDGQPTESQTL